MRIVYNDIIPFKGFCAMMLFGVIFARKKYKPLPEVVVSHEMIHRAQAKDCGGYVWFYIQYLHQWLKCGYWNNPFEREAYAHERDLNYLEERKPFAYLDYV